MTAERGEIHQMSMEIGALKNAVETMTRMWAAQEASATEKRRDLHDKVEAVRAELTAGLHAVVRRVDVMAGQITLIEPSVTSFKEEKLREEGAKQLGKVLIGAMLTVAGGFGWGIHELIGWIRHP